MGLVCERDITGRQEKEVEVGEKRKSGRKEKDRQARGVKNLACHSRPTVHADGFMHQTTWAKCKGGWIFLWGDHWSRSSLQSSRVLPYTDAVSVCNDHTVNTDSSICIDHSFLLMFSIWGIIIVCIEQLIDPLSYSQPSHILWSIEFSHQKLLRSILTPLNVSTHRIADKQEVVKC